jgi:tetratricopeptide (TPR) repeat protein
VRSYSHSEVARILRISRDRLRYWQRTALVAPSVESESARGFGFRDLVAVKHVVSLLEDGVPLRRIRRSVAAIRERLPEVATPLESLQPWAPGSRRVVVRCGSGLFEPDGQMVLDFGGAPGQRVRPLAVDRGAAGVGEEAGARDWFEQGCRLDGSPETSARAIECYERALALDPDFADAHCNLGTVHYNVGRRALARAAWQRALAIVPGHVEAHFNLASLLEDEDQNEAALHHLREAMRADPLYADVRLSLALLYEKLGLPRRAREHWRRYLQLAPTGRWAELARSRLEGA